MSDPMQGARPRYQGPSPNLAAPSRPEDFRVTELPLYPASGEGEHLFLLVEKRGLTTPQLIARIAETLGIDEREPGHAGMKDRHAVTRQWISLPRKTAEPGLSALGDGDYRVLEAKAHGNKLRPGHLAANRFELFLSGEAEEDFISERLGELRRRGLPNYFGHQRFGAAGDNHLAGRRLLEGKRKPRGGRAKLMANAWQSYLFNHVLAGRLDGLGRLLPGDLAWIHGKGAVFTVADAAAEQGRLDALEISPSGPLPGRKMSACRGEAGERELELLREAGWREEQDRFLAGARRPLIVPVADLGAEAEPGGWRLRFMLPPGSYATVLLRELGIEPGRKE